MRVARRLLKGGLLFLPAVLILVGGVIGMRRWTAYLFSERNLARILSATATQVLGREVRVARIRFRYSPFRLTQNTVHLYNVFVAASPQTPNKPLGTAKQVKLSYSLTNLLFVHNLQTPYLTKMELVAPTLLAVRNQKGEWNLAQFYKPSAKPSRPLVRKIAIRDGLLRYRDSALLQPHTVPLHAKVAHLGGAILFLPDRTIALELQGQGQEGLIGALRTTLVVFPDQRIAAHFAGNAVALSPLFQQLPQRYGRVLAGQANFRLALIVSSNSQPNAWQLGKRWLQLEGTFQLQHASIQFPKIQAPITNLQASLAVFPTEYSGEITGSAAGSSWRIRGSVLGPPKALAAPSRGGIIVQAVGIGQNIDIARFRNAVNPLLSTQTLSPQIREALTKVRGRVRTLQIALGGPLLHPTVQLRGNASGLAYQVYHAENIHLLALYSHKVLTADLRGLVAGSPLALRTQVHVLPAWWAEGELRAHDVALREVGHWFHKSLRGRGRLDLAFRAEKGSPIQWNGQALVTNLQMKGRRLALAYVTAFGTPNQFYIKNLRLEDDLGIALAHGLVDWAHQKLDLRIVADEVDIGGLLREVFQEKPTKAPLFKEEAANSQSVSKTVVSISQLQGVGYLRAQLTGTFQRPQLKGVLNAFSLQVGQLAFDRLNAGFLATPNKLQIVRGLLEAYPGELAFRGMVDGLKSKDPGISLIGAVSHVDVADLLKSLSLLKQLPASNLSPGSIVGSLESSELDVGGTLHSLRLLRPVTLTLQNAAIHGVPLTTAEATLSYSTKEGVDLQNVRIATAGGMLVAQGTLSPDNEVQATLIGSGLNIPELLTLFTGDTYADFTGNVGFVGQLSGPLKTLQATARLTLSDLAYRGAAIGSLTGQVAYRDNLVSISQASLVPASLTRSEASPSGTPTVSQETITAQNLTYQIKDQSISGSISWSNIQLPRILSLFVVSPYAITTSTQKLITYLNGFNPPLSGAFSGSIQLNGTLPKPIADARFQLIEARLGNNVITKMQGSGRLTKEGVQMPLPSTSEAALRLESPEATLISRKIQIAFDGPIQGDLSIYNFNLSYLSSWFPFAASSVLPAQGASSLLSHVKGAADIFVEASGTTKNPALDISADARDVVVHTNFRDYQIQSVDVSHLHLEEPRAILDPATISVAVGTNAQTQQLEAQVYGSAAFTWQPPFIRQDADIDFTAEVPKQKIELVRTFIPSLAFNTDGTFSLSAHVTNTMKNPLLDGALRLQASRLQLGYIDPASKKPRYLRTGLQNVSGGILFTGTQVQVSNDFQAETCLYDLKTGKPIPSSIHRLHLFGTLPLTQQSTNGITLQADSLLFDESPIPGFHSGTIRGDAQVLLQVVGSLAKPELLGDLHLRDALAVPPSDIGGTGTGGFLIPILRRFQVALHLDRKVQLSTSALNAQVGGLVIVSGAPPQATSAELAVAPSAPLAIRLNGTLDIHEGRLNLPTSRFTIIPPGRITLAYPVVDPEQPNIPELGINVDLRAQTYMSLEAPGTLSRVKRYRVIVDARGPVTGNVFDPVTQRSRLQLNFQTDPPDFMGDQQLLEQRFLAALGGPVLKAGTFGFNPTQLFTQQITSLVAGAVLPAIFEQPARTLGFEELGLNYGPFQRLNLVISRHIFGPLYFTYTRTLSSTRVLETFKISFRFTRRLQLSLQQDEQGIQSVVLEGVTQF